jgi:hypothetical protein
MEIRHYIPGLICIALALVVMFRLMHYAHFYAPSYFFWIGAILFIAGLVSLIYPLDFIFISNRTIALAVILCGIVISVSSLFWPVKLEQSATTYQQIDGLMPAYSFNELHEVRIKASPNEVKEVFRVTGVNDIPVVHLLMKIRGIADEDVDLSDRASNNKAGTNTFTTPDFNFFVVAPDEYIAVMILKPTMISGNKGKPAPPEISTLEQFIAFHEPGYMKVVINFRIIGIENKETLLTTETRVDGTTKTDSYVFGRYWRVIYPGSAIIRRVWLDTIKKKVEHKLKRK